MDILNEIAKRIEENPDKICFVHRSEKLSYRQLGLQSDAIAAWIAEAYPNNRAPIMVHGHMGPEMPVLFLACVKSGHAYVPLDTSIPRERIALIAESCSSPLIFTGDSEKLPLLQTDCVEKDRFDSLVRTYQNRRPDPESAVQEKETFYIIYTSGSTGRPKGVQIPRRSLESFTAWMNADFGLKSNEIFLNQAPFSFDLSVMDLYPSLITGGTLWAIDREMITRPKELFDSFAASGMSIWTSTPSFAEMCLIDPSFSEELLPALHTFFFCGEALPVPVARRLRKRFPNARIVNTYGPTETTVAVTSVEITQQMLATSEAFPVGSCKPGGRILILNPKSGSIVPDGEKGEIVICGASVGNGYLGEPEKTAAAFETIEGLPAYHTRDVGKLINGMLYYCGRMDHQIKLHGFRMELEEIEYILNTCEYVKRSLVIPVKKGDRYDHLISLIIPENSPFESDYQLYSAIRKQLANILPAYMIPRKFICQSSFPMTANGKIDRKSLLAEAVS